MYITRFVGLSLFAGIQVMCVGCTRSVRVAYNPGVVQPPIETYPVSLNLSKEFCEYQHRTSAVLGATLFPRVKFGASLRTYAIHVAKSVFGDVEVLDGGSARTSSKLILEPKVLSSSVREGQDIFDPHSGALCVQWIFRDPGSGQTLLTIPTQCEYMEQKKHWKTIAIVMPVLMAKLTDTTLYRFKESKNLQQLINPK